MLSGDLRIDGDGDGDGVGDGNSDTTEKCRQACRRRTEMRQLIAVTGDAAPMGEQRWHDAAGEEHQSRVRRARAVYSPPPVTEKSVRAYASASGSAQVVDRPVAFGSVSQAGRTHEMEDAVSVRRMGGIFDGDGGSHKTILVQTAMDEAVKLAEEALADRDIQRAMDIIDEACRNHSFYTIAHLARARIYQRVSTTYAEDVEAKLRLKTAADSAGQAFHLSRSSIYLLSVYSSMLYSSIPISSDRHFYDEVVSVCDFERNIRNPIDPAKECQINDRKMVQLSTPDTRIQHCRELIWYTRHNAEKCANQHHPWLVDTSVAVDNPSEDDYEKLRLKAKFYQNFLNTNQQKALFSLSLKDLRVATTEYQNYSIRSQYPNNLDSLLLDALSIAETNGSFQQWPCCYCNAVLVSDKYHIDHMVNAHVAFHVDLDSSKYLTLMTVVPQYADVSTLKDFTPSVWTPLGHYQESSLDHANRSKLLKQIRIIFERLSEQSILSDSHLEMIRSLAEGDPFVQKQVDEFESNELIRYISATQLNRILKVLEELEGANSSDRVDLEIEENFIEPSYPPILGNNSEALVDWLYNFSTGHHPHILEWNKMLKRSREITETHQVEFSFLCLLCKEKLRYSNALENLSKYHVEHVPNRGSSSVNLLSTGKVHELVSEYDDLRMKICRIDAGILWTLRTIHQLETKIGPASVYNYRNALKQFVKKIIQMRWEIIMEKGDAIIKQAFDDLTEKFGDGFDNLWNEFN